MELDIDLLGRVDDGQAHRHHGGGAEQADHGRAPEQGRDAVDHRQGEDVEAVVHVEDGVGGAEGVAVEEEEHVLPVPGEVGASSDPSQHGDRDPDPEGDPARPGVDRGDGARPKGTLTPTSAPVRTSPIRKRTTWAIRGVQKTLEWPRLER